MGEIPSTGTIGKEIPFTATTILSKDSSGDYREIGASASLPVSMGDGGGIDAFNRMRISAPASIFDSKQIYDKQPLYWDELLTGSTSTHYPNLACTRLLLPANTAGTSAIRQTKEYFNYQPGRSQLIQITGKMGLTSNVTYRVGLFDANNGLFFEQANGTKYVVARGYMTGSAVDTRIAQSDWNIDKLDGTGESGITLDWTKVQFWVIDFQWLGVGRVRFGMVVNGLLYYCHQRVISNIGESVYMSTPSLPLRYEVAATSGGPTVESGFDCICAALFSEGGQDPRGLSSSIGMVASRQAASGTRSPMIAVRLKAANIRAHAIIENVEILTGTNQIFWELILNPTLTSPSWVSAGANSILEYDVSGTSGAGGFVIRSGYAANQVASISETINSSLKLVANIAGTSDIILLTARGVSGNSACYGAIKWREIV